jgi:hypothetical protein
MRLPFAGCTGSLQIRQEAESRWCVARFPTFLAAIACLTTLTRAPVLTWALASRYTHDRDRYDAITANQCVSAHRGSSQSA